MGQAAFTQKRSGLRGLFSTALNAAVRAEVIPENPIMTLAATERIKVPESKREYLTIDEIKILIDTECPREDVKRAYLSPVTAV